MKMRVLLLLVAVGFGITACSDPNTTKSEPNVELIQDMMEQPALKTQDFTPGDREKSGMRVPPAGTVPQNRDTYLYEGNLQGAIANLKNPHESDTQFLERGQKNYMNYCFVCHGATGKGDGPVAPKFQGVKPPALVSSKVVGMKDGQIFHIITEGQGVMGHYANHMPFFKDRWAVVSYVRKLQKENK